MITSAQLLIIERFLKGVQEVLPNSASVSVTLDMPLDTVLECLVASGAIVHSENFLRMDAGEELGPFQMDLGFSQGPNGAVYTQITAR